MRLIAAIFALSILVGLVWPTSYSYSAGCSLWDFLHSFSNCQSCAHTAKAKDFLRLHPHIGLTEAEILKAFGPPDWAFRPQDRLFNTCFEYTSLDVSFVFKDDRCIGGYPDEETYGSHGVSWLREVVLPKRLYYYDNAAKVLSRH